MTKSKKRIARIFLCPLMALSVLMTGCGAPQTEAENQDTQAGQQVESTQSALKASSCGKIMGKVTDSNSNVTVAGIIVLDSEGNSYMATTNAYGGYDLALEPGTYTLTFTKGAEWDTCERTVTVESLKTYYQQDVRLPQLYDSYAKGYIAGDAHQHTAYSDGVDSVDSLILANAAAGLYWGFLTDHNNSRGVPEWGGASRVNVATDEGGVCRYFTGLDGVEVTAEFGHFNSLGSGLTLETYDTQLTEAERSSDEKLDYIHENIEYIADCIRRVGGLAQLNHPYSTTTMGVANWVAEDDYDLFDMFDTVEIWNGYFLPPDGIYTDHNSQNQNYTAKLLWYNMLNQMKNGHSFLACTGGTDNHDSAGAVSAADRAKVVENVTSIDEYYNNYVYSGKYSGNPTTYAQIDGEVNMESVKTALKNGNSFVSNGPVVICDIDGASYGDALVPTANELQINTDIFNRDGIEEIRIVVNGEVAKTVSVGGETTYTSPITIEKEWESFDWILIEVLGPLGQYAITNPIIIG